LKATEARKITENNLRGPIIEPLLKVAYARIAEFAKQGKYSVPHPFHGVENYPSMDVQEAAADRLRMDGYKVKYYDNPDIDDPRSTSYWEVSW